MPAKVEDAVAKVMTPGKVADGTKDRVIMSCTKWGWDEGPFTVSLLLEPSFCIGTSLCDTCHEEFSSMCRQTADGQKLAVDTYCDQFDQTKQRWKEDEWQECCIGSGMWSQIVAKVLPECGFSESDIQNLNNEFARDNSCLSKACARIVMKEPEPAVGGKALATWILNQVPMLKTFLAEKISGNNLLVMRWPVLNWPLRKPKF